MDNTRSKVAIFSDITNFPIEIIMIKKKLMRIIVRFLILKKVATDVDKFLQSTLLFL